MTEPVLLVERSEGIATLVLNRPDVLNALSERLRNDFAAAVEDLREDDEIGVVIVTGAGRAFCAGLDLKEMSDPDRKRGSIADPPKLLRSLPQPVIGAINGLAVTGGFEIALSCDLLIAVPEARFADTHARVGLLSGWGLSARLARVIGPGRAKELSLTGNYLSAERACEWGLVNRIVPRNDLLPACRRLAADMLSCQRDVMFQYKRMIDRGFDLTLGDAMDHEVEVNRMYRPPGPEEVGERLADIRARGRAQSEAAG